MPSCRITNYTTQPLNVSLKHLCALHFENEIAPGQTVKLKPGRVWFTLEVLVDDKKNRYSMAQSAAAIAIVSLACVGTAALAVPAAAGASTAGVGSAIIAHAGTAVTTVGSAVVAGAGPGILAVGDTLVTGFGTVYGAAQGFLAAHGATAAKLSAAFLPRAIEAVEKEVGGFTAVQKEVVAILSSPTVSEDVRKSGFSILSRLGAAVAADRATEAERAAKEKSDTLAPPPYSKDGPSSSGTSTPSTSAPPRPSLKRLPTSVSTLLHSVTEGREERKASRRAASESQVATRQASNEAKVATKHAKQATKDAASWEVVSIEDDVAAGKVLSSSSAAENKRVCVHGLFMSERRHFEVREREGKLVLIDGNTGVVVVG
jgi:hypothetical protein